LSLVPLYLSERAQEKNNNTPFSEKTQPFFFHTLFPGIFGTGMRAKAGKL